MLHEGGIDPLSYTGLGLPPISTARRFFFGLAPGLPPPALPCRATVARCRSAVDTWVRVRLGLGLGLG